MVGQCPDFGWFNLGYCWLSSRDLCGLLINLRCWVFSRFRCQAGLGLVRGGVKSLRFCRGSGCGCRQIGWQFLDCVGGLSECRCRLWFYGQWTGLCRLVGIWGGEESALTTAQLIPPISRHSRTTAAKIRAQRYSIICRGWVMLASANEFVLR